MGHFLFHIKEYTCALRNGTCSENIVLRSGIHDEDDTLLLHDDALLPHWKEFATALYKFIEIPRLLTMLVSTTRNCHLQ